MARLCYRIAVCISDQDHSATRRRQGVVSWVLAVSLMLLLSVAFVFINKSEKRTLNWISNFFIDGEELGKLVPDNISLASNYMYYYSLAIAVIFPTIIFYCTKTHINNNNNHEDTGSSLLAVATIYPTLGVQLTTEIGSPIPDTDSTVILKRQFISRDQIVDCIVYEVVLSYKVKTTIAFRIQSPDRMINHNKKVGHDNDGDGDADADNYIQEQQSKLIPVFPSNTELTYRECIFMRHKIVQALGI